MLKLKTKSGREYEEAIQAAPVRIDATEIDARAPIILAVILAFAVAIRFFGINAGLPLFPSLDEQRMIRGAMEVWEGVTPEALGWPGTFFMLLTSLSFLVYFLGGHLPATLAGVTGDRVELLETVNDFYVLFYTDPTYHYLIARSWSVLFGVATVALVFLIGRRLYRPATGLVAAALLTIAPHHVLHSRLAIADVTMTFFVTAALYFSLRILHRPQNRFYWLAAAMVGLAMANKLNGAIAFLPLIFCHLAAYSNPERSPLNRIWDRRLWTAVVIAFGAFYLATPYLVTAPSVVLKELAYSTVGRGTAGLSPGLFRSTFEDAFTVLGVVILVSSGIAVVLLFRGRERENRLMQAILLTSLLLAFSYAMSSVKHQNYLLPLLPLLSILAGFGIVRTWAYLVPFLRIRGLRQWAFLSVVALLLLPSGMKTLSAAVDLSDADRRGTAKEWIEAHIPEGSRIAVESSIVPLTRNSISIERTLERIGNEKELRDEKARRIAGFDEYPVVAFSNVVINDERVIERQYEFLLWASENDRQRSPSYDIIDFADGPHVLPIESSELLRMIANGAIDYVISVDKFDGIGDLVKEWEGIHLYRPPKEGGKADQASAAEE